MVSLIDKGFPMELASSYFFNISHFSHAELFPADKQPWWALRARIRGLFKYFEVRLP